MASLVLFILLCTTFYVLEKQTDYFYIFLRKKKTENLEKKMTANMMAGI